MLLAKCSNGCARAKSVCSFVSLVQTNLGTKSVCNLVAKRPNGFGYTNLDDYRSHMIEKKRPTLMGTKNLYENGPNPFFLFSFFFFLFSDHMGTRLVQIRIEKSV